MPAILTQNMRAVEGDEWHHRPGSARHSGMKHYSGLPRHGGFNHGADFCSALRCSHGALNVVFQQWQLSRGYDPPSGNVRRGYITQRAIKRYNNKR